MKHTKTAVTVAAPASKEMKEANKSEEGIVRDKK